MIRWGYGFIFCSRCRRKLKVRVGQKYRFCPYCNKQVKIKKFYSL